MKIVIYEEVKGTPELVELLSYIAGLIEDGCTSGYHPGWKIEKEA